MTMHAQTPHTITDVRDKLRAGTHRHAADVRAVTRKDTSEIIGFTFENGGLYGATDAHGIIVVSSYLRRGTATAYLHRNAPAAGEVGRDGHQVEAAETEAPATAVTAGTLEADAGRPVIRNALAVLNDEPLAAIGADPATTGWHVRPDVLGRPDQVIVRWVNQGSFRPVSLQERDARRAVASRLFTGAGWTAVKGPATVQVFRAPAAAPTPVANAHTVVVPPPF